jgi:hypothetical protein
VSDDLPFYYGETPPPDDRPPKPCRHPRYLRASVDGIETCMSCGHAFDPMVKRRGRNNRSRGNAMVGAVGMELGVRRVGQYGGPDDLSGSMFAAQVKSGGSFSERYWAWLKAVPVTADQTPILVVADAPGPGHKRRAMVILELSDWRALHGEDAA